MIRRTEPVEATGLNYDRALQAGCALAFLGVCALFFSFVADDAYIVGRYAKNAASGHGLVYNPGEWVTALTSPLHALLETVLSLLGLDPVKSYRLIAPIVVLMGWFVAVQTIGLRGSSLLLFTALSLFSPFLALWTIGGLETPILASLATLFASKLILIKRNGTATGKDFMIVGGLAAVMFLTRHDSVIVTGPILVAIAAVEWRRPALWMCAAISTLIAGSWLTFSFVYYGEILPTSYYVKLAVLGRPPIDSIGALINFFFLSGFIIVVLFARRTNSSSPTILSKAIALGAFISLVLFLMYSTRAAGQHMMFGYRHFVPYLMASSLVLTLLTTAVASRLAIVAVSWQIAMIAIVNFNGVNPALLARLPILNQAYVEYKYITPKTYGAFMDMLRDDAHAIRGHWQERQIEEKPRIYLRTGGTGYWLPDFYVYEALVSYRHDCGVPEAAMVNASHYMQQLGFSRSGKAVQNTGRLRDDIADDADLLFATEMDWMGPSVTGYLFGADPVPLELGDTVGANCSFGDLSQ